MSLNTITAHPKKVGKYEIERFLGGGMSQVYRAMDPVLGRRVALKILSPQAAADPEAKARFLREARVASHIDHHNIIDIFDFGEQEDGTPFMVMEYLEGITLRQAILDGRAGDLRKRLEIAVQVGRCAGAANCLGEARNVDSHLALINS